MAKEAKTQKRDVMDWLVPVICAVIAVIVLVGLLVSPVKNGIDYIRSRSITLLESEDGSVEIKRPVAQSITWLQLYQSFQQSYLNYSVYKYYHSIFGDGIDLSSFISDSEVSWLEQNVSYMEQNLGLKFYTQVDVTDDGSITSADIEKSAATFAAYLASGTESNISSYLSGTFHDLKHYVSIAAAAKAAGVTLTDEDLAEIDSEMSGFSNLREIISYNRSLKRFIKDFVGRSVTEDDLREAYKLMSLVSKYSTQVTNDTYDSATDADREKFVSEHKDEFYTAKYLKYTTENETLATFLKTAADKDSFIALAVGDILDGKYAALVAKKEQSILSLSNYEDEIAASLTGAGFGELTTYAKGSNTLEAALADAIFTNDEHESSSLQLVEGDENVYLVWYASNSAEEASVRIKTFPKDGLESYSEIPDFRSSLYADVKEAIKTGAEEPSYKYDDTAYLELVDEAISAVKEVVPTETTASFKSDAEEGSFEAWISADATKAGDIRSTETTEDGKTQYTFEFVISAMALDETASIVGEFHKYDTEDEAKKAKDELADKTGVALVMALGDITSITSISGLTEGDLDVAELKDWFFSSDRKMNDLAIIAVETEDDSSDSEESTTKTAYYLVGFRSANKAWEVRANAGFTTEKTNAWVEALEETVKVNEKELTRLGVDLSEDEE